MIETGKDKVGVSQRKLIDFKYNCFKNNLPNWFCVPRKKEGGKIYLGPAERETGFYTECIENTPDNVEFKGKSKFEDKVLVW